MSLLIANSFPVKGHKNDHLYLRCNSKGNKMVFCEYDHYYRNLQQLKQWRLM